MNKKTITLKITITLDSQAQVEVDKIQTIEQPVLKKTRTNPNRFIHQTTLPAAAPRNRKNTHKPS